MACCLLAAMVIGRWLGWWESVRHRLGCAKAWLQRRPAPASPVSTAGPQRFKLSRNAKVFVAAEAVALALLVAHEASGAHHEALHASVDASREAAQICRASDGAEPKSQPLPDR